MHGVQLYIRCNKDMREEEDIKTSELLRDLGISSEQANENIIQEWRSGVVFTQHIEAFYPHSRYPQHTILQLTSGVSLTIRESIEEFIQLLQPPNPQPEKLTKDGKRIYEYQITYNQLPSADN